jgi:DNA-binding response OmpR family regulator
MTDDPPYALVIDHDNDSRKQASALLGEAGFVVAGFARTRGALAALVAHRADLAVIAAHRPDGSDGFAVARQARHCQADLKVLFTATAGAGPAASGDKDGHVITRPFDRRRFLGAVFELLAREEPEPGGRHSAELGILEAELACLAARYAAAERSGAQPLVRDLTCQIRDAMAARQSLLLSASIPRETR